MYNKLIILIIFSICNLISNPVYGKDINLRVDNDNHIEKHCCHSCKTQQVVLLDRQENSHNHHHNCTNCFCCKHNKKYFFPLKIQNLFNKKLIPVTTDFVRRKQIINKSIFLYSYDSLTCLDFFLDTIRLLI